MAAEKENETLRFEPDESCSALTAAVTGLQLAIVVVALVVVPVVIVFRTSEQPEAYLTWAVFGSLVICGVATIMQSLKAGRVGTGHILVIGTAEPAMAICITALIEGGPTMMASLVTLSSLLKFFVAMRLSLFRRIITPVVSGTVLMLIAATVILAVFKILTDVPDGIVVSPLAAPLASITTLTVVSLLLLRAPRSLQLWSPIVGIIAGCAIALPFGLYDSHLVAESAWFGIPEVAWPGLQLSPGKKFWALLPAFLLITVITSFKGIADIGAVQRVSRRRPRASDFRLIQSGLSINGLSNLASGLFGTIPTMTASPSIAMISLTGVASRSVGLWAGGIFIALALFPKITGVLLAVPAPVAAAYIMIIMGLVFIEGLQTVTEGGVDHKKAVVVAVSFWVGMGFQNQAIFSDLLTGTWNALLSNSVTSGGLAAAMMIAFIELTSSKRKRLEAELNLSSLSEVDVFLQRFAADRRWDGVSSKRLRAVGEETLAIMTQYSDIESDKHRRLIVNAHSEGNIVVLEFLSATHDDENLEDRLAYLSGEPELHDGTEVSYRLLRYYASTVRHQKFHNIDVITVKVEGTRAC